ncbi:MAG: NAD(P)-binding protein [Gammaproteobacteria bacterium]|nr:NAD(P)-binding protein [Gammaproteobacteria bacterium]
MKVAIIGAGISGLTAAQELMARGVEVKVFEKSRGVGGRLASKRLEWGNVDIGAQYFTARDQRFQPRVAQWQEDKVAARWQFQPHSLSAAGLIPSPDSTLRYVGTPNMNSLAQALARGVEIDFNTRIDALQASANGWTLVTADGCADKQHFDWVVLTLPAEQSAALLAGTALEQQIPTQVHEPCWALALATRGDVPADIQGIFGDDVVSWVSRLSARPQRQASEHYDDLWLLHFSGDWSTINGKDTGVDIAQAGLDWLAQALQMHAAKPLQAVYHYKHYWRYARLKDDTTTASIIADRSAGIAAIGAWSAGGRVEGAYLSGLDFVDYFFA